MEVGRYYILNHRMANERHRRGGTLPVTCLQQVRLTCNVLCWSRQPRHRPCCPWRRSRAMPPGLLQNRPGTELPLRSSLRSRWPPQPAGRDLRRGRTISQPGELPSPDPVTGMLAVPRSNPCSCFHLPQRRQGGSALFLCAAAAEGRRPPPLRLPRRRPSSSPLDP